MLKSILIVIFTYGGISAVAMASSEILDPKKQIPKATIMMTLGFAFLYLVSITIITLLVYWNSVNTSESPFVSAPSKVGIKSASAIMNAVILISTISVMLAAFYSRLSLHIYKFPKLIYTLYHISENTNFVNQMVHLEASNEAFPKIP